MYYGLRGRVCAGDSRNEGVVPEGLRVTRAIRAAHGRWARHGRCSGCDTVHSLRNAPAKSGPKSLLRAGMLVLCARHIHGERASKDGNVTGARGDMFQIAARLFRIFVKVRFLCPCFLSLHSVRPSTAVIFLISNAHLASLFASLLSPTFLTRS